MVMLSA